MFNDKIMNMLLGAGLFLILYGVVTVFGLDIRPAAWLFYLDVRYWSIYVPIVLWLTAIWVILESTDIAGNYLSPIRTLLVTSILVTAIFALRSSFTAANPTLGEQSIWFYIIAIVLACCIIRSFFLFYHYRYGEDNIDLEEARWFWGFSGFILVGLVVWGLMCIIPVKIHVYDTVYTESLFMSCNKGLQELLRTGNGSSLALRMFALLLLVSFIAFAYVTGRWFLLIFSIWRNHLMNAIPALRTLSLWFYAATLLLICMMVVIGINTRPNAWLFYLDMRYWSIYVSIALWITAVWVLLESTDIVEDFLPFIRILMTTCILLVIVLTLRDSLMVSGSAHRDYAFWFYISIIITACCLTRSLFLFYAYRYGEDDIDLEEAQWFWGITGCILVGLAVWGLMCIIPVNIQVYGTVYTESLFKSYSNGLQELLRTGTGGSLALRMFTLLLLVLSIAFAYVAGRWLLIIYLKIRGE